MQTKKSFNCIFPFKTMFSSRKILMKEKKRVKKYYFLMFDFTIKNMEENQI